MGKTLVLNTLWQWSTVLFLVLSLVGLILFAFFFSYPITVSGKGLLLINGQIRQVVSPSFGALVQLLKQEGDVIRRGEIIGVVGDFEQAAHETVIISHIDGVVTEILAFADSVVQRGQPVVLITELGDVRRDLKVIGFIASGEGKKLKPGMSVIMDPTVTHSYFHGHLLGTIEKVSALPQSQDALRSMIRIPGLTKLIEASVLSEPFFLVVSLKPDPNQASGYAWSGPGPSFQLDAGVLVDLEVETQRASIVSILWPSRGRP